MEREIRVFDVTQGLFVNLFNVKALIYKMPQIS